MFVVKWMFLFNIFQHKSNMLMPYKPWSARVDWFTTSLWIMNKYWIETIKTDKWKCQINFLLLRFFFCFFTFWRILKPSAILIYNFKNFLYQQFLMCYFPENVIWKIIFKFSDLIYIVLSMTDRSTDEIFVCI